MVIRSFGFNPVTDLIFIKSIRMLHKIDIIENTKYISLKLFETEIHFKLEDMVKP